MTTSQPAEPLMDRLPALILGGIAWVFRGFGLALRAIEPQVRVYIVGAALAGLGTWLWVTSMEPVGQWTRQRGSAGPSMPLGRQMLLYRPATQPTSERLEFDWKPDERAVAVMYRVTGGDTYYATRISRVPATVFTALIAERFAVIDGIEGPPARKLIPLIGSASQIKVRLEGDHDRFQLYLQGSQADSWEDNRIPHGGLGFFYGQEGLPSVQSVRVSFPGGAEGEYTGSLASVVGDLN